MLQTWRWFGPDDPVSLENVAEAGAVGVVTALHHKNRGEAWPVDDILERRAAIESAGLVWPVVESIGVGEEIKTRSGDFRQKIDNYKQSIRNAARLGGDPGRVFLAGHSSGAHLAACVLTTDWTARGLPADAIKGGFLMSGMYDLYPVMLSSRSSYLHITPAEVIEFSPIRHLDRITCPIAVLSADEDSPEFKRQSDVFGDALKGMGRLASRTVVFDANHFREPERLSHADSAVSRAAFALIGI